MADTWIPGEFELAKVAATVPLLSSLGVVSSVDGRVAGHWSRAGSLAIDHAVLAGLLVPAGRALGGTAEVAMTIVSSTQSVVIAELSPRWTVVFGFSEAVSYDWATYYVRRALGVLRRKEG